VVQDKGLKSRICLPDTRETVSAHRSSSVFKISANLKITIGIIELRNILGLHLRCFQWTSSW